MQNLELERRLHEFRDLIGRDAEVIKRDQFSEWRTRGPIKRVFSDTDPDTGLKEWWLEVEWSAHKYSHVTGGSKGWELDKYFMDFYRKYQEDLGEVADSFPLGGTIFKTSDLIEKADGILVRTENNPLKYYKDRLIIHRPGDNLALESVAP